MTTAEKKNGAPTDGAAHEQVNNLTERFIGPARKAGSLYVDAYEKAVNRAIDLQLNVAGLTRQEWLKSLVEEQADLARDLTESYTTAARSLLK